MYQRRPAALEECLHAAQRGASRVGSMTAEQAAVVGAILVREPTPIRDNWEMIDDDADVALCSLGGDADENPSDCNLGDGFVEVSVVGGDCRANLVSRRSGGYEPEDLDIPEAPADSSTATLANPVPAPPPNTRQTATPKSVDHAHREAEDVLRRSAAPPAQLSGPDGCELCLRLKQSRALQASEDDTEMPDAEQESPAPRGSPPAAPKPDSPSPTPGSPAGESADTTDKQAGEQPSLGHVPMRARRLVSARQSRQASGRAPHPEEPSAGYTTVIAQIKAKITEVKRAHRQASEKMEDPDTASSGTMPTAAAETSAPQPQELAADGRRPSKRQRPEYPVRQPIPPPADLSEIGFGMQGRTGCRESMRSSLRGAAWSE